jgi:FkbM family methyltransferase
MAGGKCWIKKRFILLIMSPRSCSTEMATNRTYKNKTDPIIYEFATAARGIMGHWRAVRHLAEKLTGTLIYAKPPHGLDPFFDIKANLPGVRISTVFDVGANVGQTACEFAKHYPASQIYCFEPVHETFGRLQRDLGACSNIHTFNFGLGARSGQRKMILEGAHQMYHLQPEYGEAPVGENSARVEQVSLQTLDEFCERQGITHIDFLKIDTEGNDLDVLTGADDMLHCQEVDIVQVEAGMSHRNRRHVRFELFMEFMEQRGYYLFGIYEQRVEWLSRAPNLRRTNPIFISDRVVSCNTAI